MDKKLSLARKVIKAYIVDRDFVCVLRAYEGGACGDGWCDDRTIRLKKAELLYLLKCEINKDELFKGMEIKKFDLDSALEEEAYSSSWDGEEKTARPNGEIPCELEDLGDYINSDECDIEEARKRILEIKGGKYTFICSVEQNDYLISEFEDVQINLTKEEALKLLYNYVICSDNIECFDEICDDTMEPWDFEDRLTKAVQGDDNQDSFSYSGECESFDYYIKGWKYLISNILSGDIESGDIDKWLPYFEDNDNLTEDIESWYKYNCDD